MIQYADLLAHGIRRYFEKGDSTYVYIVFNRLDNYGGVLHGLVHDVKDDCNCYACRAKGGYPTPPPKAPSPP